MELYQQVSAIPELEVAGLMCMAPKGGDARGAFGKLRGLRDGIMNGSLRPPGPLELCMGMSDDWKIAVEQGATMVRLGSTLFGRGPQQQQQQDKDK